MGRPRKIIPSAPPSPPETHVEAVRPDNGTSAKIKVAIVRAGKLGVDVEALGVALAAECVALDELIDALDRIEGAIEDARHTIRQGIG